MSAGERTTGGAGEQSLAHRVEVLARSANEAVVYKPAGLSSERGPTDAGESLISLARARFSWPECQLPHRLDRPTRGIMMLSATRAQAAVHASEIREGRWTKWYLARVPRESPAPARAQASSLVGEHKAYLKREGKVARVVRSGGDPSRMTVLAVQAALDSGDDAHLLIRLDTGRFHQIRVMCAALGFPLRGDRDYGGTQRRGAHSQQFPSIDLEAIALRIARADGTVLYRLPQHVDRIGVSGALESALDAVAHERT